jgi:hypothetical protein
MSQGVSIRVLATYILRGTGISQVKSAAKFGYPPVCNSRLTAPLLSLRIQIGRLKWKNLYIHSFKQLFILSIIFFGFNLFTFSIIYKFLGNLIRAFILII